MLSQTFCRRILIGVLLTNVQSLVVAQAPPSPTASAASEAANARDIIKNALPFIEKQGQKWMNDKKCVTCHHSTFMTWSLNRASEHGFPVEKQSLSEWNEWTRNFRNIQGKNNKDFETEPAEVAFQRSSDVVAQLLLGRPAYADNVPSEEQQWSSEMADHLLTGQQPDGNWKAGGQLPLQKRSVQETEEVSTLWSLYALLLFNIQDERLSTADSKAATWLNPQTVGESTEWWAVKLLWARKRGDSEVADACREKLIQTQHDDGGWGWLLTDESDALGTGIAMYALQHDGVTFAEPVIANAVSFLRTTQNKDGSWSVKGTKKAKKNRVEATATYWGTCWAVISLLETLPKATNN